MALPTPRPLDPECYKHLPEPVSYESRETARTEEDRPEPVQTSGP